MIEPGNHIGKYRIVHKLGAGGMADVYCAEDSVMGRQVAFKVLPPVFARDLERVARFEKEVRNLAALEHPHIVTIYDVGHDDGCHYYTMALLSGGDLKQRIAQSMRPDQALAIVRQMAEALDYAHAKGLIHRDIKPENILFDDRDRPLLTDLGIAKAIGAGTQMTKTGMSIGTPHYMSPEQARGKAVDGRSDLYSLGVILYEMLTGAVPYHAEDTFAVALKHVNDPLPELPGHLAAFQPLIDRLMAKNPNERFADAGALIGAIDHLQSGRRLERPASATRVMPTAGAPPRPAPPASGGGGLKWALGGALLALLIAVGVIYHQSRDSAPMIIGAGPSASPATGGISELAPARSPAVNPAVPQPQAQTEAQRRETEQADAHRRAAEQAEAHRREQQARIDQLLSTADQDITALRLTLPAGNNALDKYRQVLALDAGNARAQEGLSRIVSRYIELSDTAIGKRDFNRARRHLDNAQRILPKEPNLQSAAQRLVAARAKAEQEAIERAVIVDKYVDMANNAVEKEDYEKAELYLSKAKTINPDSALIAAARKKFMAAQSASIKRDRLAAANAKAKQDQLSNSKEQTGNHDSERKYGNATSDFQHNQRGTLVVKVKAAPAAAFVALAFGSAHFLKLEINGEELFRVNTTTGHNQTISLSPGKHKILVESYTRGVVTLGMAGLKEQWSNTFQIESGELKTLIIDSSWFTVSKEHRAKAGVRDIPYFQ